ncbi:MAG: hypothetical protein ACYC6Y_13430 [Thermoguttaceae bacterium]
MPTPGSHDRGTGLQPVPHGPETCPAQGPCPDGTTALRPFAWWRERLIATEQAAGWLAQCDDHDRFLAVSQELVDQLAAVLRRLAGDETVVEVCAGSGQLACALATAGIAIRPTDAHPAAGDTAVLSMPADEALRSFQPRVVLGVFVPFDAGVDQAVLASPSVHHYLFLNARIGGMLGSDSLWQAGNWQAEPLPNVTRWMLTRHDVWLGPDCRPDAPCTDLLQHGEAWHFRRSEP